MTYRVPNIVCTSRVISLSFACCFKALASSSHRDESNPNCTKKEALLLPARWVVERRYLTILASLISALSTSGSFILNLASRQTHLASPYIISFPGVPNRFQPSRAARRRSKKQQILGALSAALTGTFSHQVGSFEVGPKECIDGNPLLWR
jgi:hypothetical protein